MSRSTTFNNWIRKIKREVARPFWSKTHSKVRAAIPLDFSPFQIKLVSKVRRYTMTSNERVAVLEAAVRHVIAQNYPGDFVECGVAEGGSTMAIALTLLQLGVTDRELFLYDTFEGMPEPGDHDVGRFGEPAMKKWRKLRTKTGVSTYINHSLDEVRANMRRTGYPDARLHYVKGKVEDTLPGEVPSGSIALLRLDTDWYNSTKVEMEWLYPKLVKGGIVIIDDYYRWQGSRKAVDEYTSKHSIPIFWARIDDTAAIGVKP